MSSRRRLGGRSYCSTFYFTGSMLDFSHLDGREILWSWMRWYSLTSTRWKQESDPRLSGLNSLTFSVWISRGAGLVLSVDGAMILLPMCRNILRYIRPKIMFLPLDESQWFHRQVAYSLLVYTIIHTSAHYVK
jgi:hypothetical protein